MSEVVTETTEAEAPKGGSKKFLIIIILAVVLLGGGGAGAYFFLFSKSAEGSEEAKEKGSKKPKAKEAEEEEPEEKGDKSSSLKGAIPNDEDVKEIVELQPFIVNLADEGEARYLRLSVSLGIGGGEGAAHEKPSPLLITRVRNAMLAVLSEKKSDDVLSNAGKVKLRKELLKAAKTAAEEAHIEAIYITDFIVQL
ncbi:MAG: flagellar basal body-associated FliL family protein [Acidobacteriota bacterium]